MLKNIFVLSLVVASFVYAELEEASVTEAPVNSEVKDVEYAPTVPSNTEEKKEESASGENKSIAAEPSSDGSTLSPGIENVAQPQNGEAETLEKLSDTLNVESTPASEKNKENNGEAESQPKEISDSKEKETAKDNGMALKNTADGEIKEVQTVELNSKPSSGEVKEKEDKTASDVEKVEIKENLKKTDDDSQPSTVPDKIGLLGTLLKTNDTKDQSTEDKTEKTKDPENDAAPNSSHIDTPPVFNYTPGTPRTPADHKMTQTEQNAFICSLPKIDSDLCPMTINLEENVGISDPGANAYCHDVIAAPMGFKGFCVALMKTNPETGLPIYTKTCAYTDKENHGKCAMNFLTSRPVTNSSQIRYSCESNGLTNYIPTSCVKRLQMQNKL